MRGLTVALAEELAADNTRLNAIAPCAIVPKTRVSNVHGKFLEDLVGQVQLIKPLATPSNLIGAAKMPYAEQGSFIAGETILTGCGACMQF